MLDEMARPAAGNLCLSILPCLPQTRDVPQPQVCGFYVHRHLTDVVLHVWIIGLLLRADIFECVVVGSLGSSQKSCCVMRYEAGLPAFFQILARITNEICVGNERATEMDQIADRSAHPNRIPPRAINLDTWVGKITS